jgi:hypothetical protein
MNEFNYIPLKNLIIIHQKDNFDRYPKFSLEFTSKVGNFYILDKTQYFI